MVGAPEVSDAVIVSATDDSHFESMVQFLDSVKLYEPTALVIVYDLGLDIANVLRLKSRYPNLEIRLFNFADFPEYFNVRVSAGQYAWKPAIIYDVIERYRKPVIWMDAGNVLTRPLNSIRRILRSVGFYSPTSQGTVLQWTHPSTLEYLRAERWVTRKQNLNGACVAFNPEFATVKLLADRWRELAFVKECIAPEGSDRANHRQDQSVLTVLAYQSGVAFKTSPFLLGFKVHCDVERPN
jgi:hypothetical protein